MDFIKFIRNNINRTKYYPLIFTTVFIVILFQYSFSSLEAVFYDFMARHDFGVKFRDDIVLVFLDEESDEFLGEKYPYSYASHYRLIRRLNKDRPKVVNYLVDLATPESKVEEDQLQKFKQEVLKLKTQTGDFLFGTSMDEWGERLPPVALRELGYGLSIINIDGVSFSKDNIARRMIVNVSGDDSLHLWSANKFRSFLGKKKIEPNKIQGLYYNREADASFAPFRYYTPPLESKERIRKIAFHRVVVGNFPQGFFTDKIVLVGPKYVSDISDYVLTPFNRKDISRVSKLMMHAELIESLIQNKTVYQVPRYISYILAILIAIWLSWIVSQVRPTRGLFITFGFLLGILLIAYLLFSMLGYAVYVVHLLLTVFIVYYIWVPFRAIIEYQRRFAIQEESILLKKVENLKKNFLSLMSHDLKTPVAKIAGVADIMMQKHREDESITKNLTAITNSTKELNGFITSILDLTKIESQKMIINKSSKDVNKIIEAVVTGLRYEASLRGVEVATDLSPLYPIEIDVNLMKRVISNLTENAIKYSGENSQVEIKSWDDSKWVYIEIKDDGVGIAEEDLRHIFDKFYRVKNDASHSIKGTGLGLYLVKYFIELQGGTISASSRLGKGTTFKIRLINS